MSELWAPRGMPGAGLPRASDSQRCPCVEPAAAEGGGCPQRHLSFQPPSAPAAQAAFVWPRSHAHPGCAPLWCPLGLGL